MRNYRIVRIAGVGYSTAEKKLYGDNPSAACMPYAQQQEALFRMACMYSDGFSRAMRALGHDAHEIIFDLKTMQKTWARENDVEFNEETWQTDIILKQIEKLRPDVVYFQDIHSLPYDVRRKLKTMFPFIKLVVVFKGFPGAFKEMSEVDLLFIGLPSMVAAYAAEGAHPHVLYHGFDEAVLDRFVADESKPTYDFTFVGSSGFGVHPGHIDRYWALVKLMNQTNLEAWVDEQLRVREQIKTLLIKIMGADDANRLSTQMLGLTIKPKTEDELERGLKEFLSRQREARENMRKRQGFPICTLHEQFSSRTHPPAFGLDMYDIFRRSRITFNIHMTATTGTNIGNIRMFETTGMGTCLLTDNGYNMPDLFEDGKEVVTYCSLDECIEKARYLLDHEDQCRSIAQAGQKRTLRDHTIRNRCQQVDAVIQPLL
jgi:spore maturation protein CgeB